MSEMNNPVRDRSDRLPLGLGDQLVGAWTLVSGSEAGDGEGCLLVTPDGYAAVQLAGGPAGDGAPLACAGPFEVDEAAGTLTLRMSPAAPAERLGAEHHIEFDGDHLSLHRDGAALEWRRAATGPQEG